MIRLAVSPASPETIAEASRINTSGSATRRKMRRGSPRLGVSSSALGPSEASRSAASASDNPAVSAAGRSTVRQNPTVAGSDRDARLALPIRFLLACAPKQDQSRQQRQPQGQSAQ